MNTVVYKLNGSIEPTGYVLGGCAIKVDKTKPFYDVLRPTVVNRSNTSKTVTIAVYNDKLYTDINRSVERTDPAPIIRTDDNGNTIYEYSITLNAGTLVSLYEGANTTWVILKNAPKSCTLMFSTSTADGQHSSSVDWYETRGRYELDLKESLSLVDENDLTSIYYINFKLFENFNIGELSAYSNLTIFNINTCHEIIGNIEDALAGKDLDDINLRIHTCPNLNGTFSRVFDAENAKITTGRPLEKTYNIYLVSTGVKLYESDENTIRWLDNSKPTVRYKADGTWELV